MAYVLISQQKMQDALPLLEAVIRQSPNYADAHYQMGRILLEQGDAAGAVERLETAVRLDPKQYYSFYQLALAYRKLGRTQDAETALKRFQALKQAKRTPPAK